MVDEPVAGQGGHPLEGAGLGEEVAGARDDLEGGLGAGHAGERLVVEVGHEVVVTADDEEGRGPDLGEAVAGEVGPPAPGDDGADVGGAGRRGEEGGGGPGAGTEAAEGRRAEIGMPAGPVDRGDHPGAEEVDVEPKLGGPEVLSLLGVGEEVDQEGPESPRLQGAGDRAVARAVPAAPAPVGEDDEPAAGIGEGEVADEVGGTGGDRDRADDAMGREGIEPSTLGLRGPCSAN